jgi:putative flippase GtrA
VQPDDPQIDWRRVESVEIEQEKPAGALVSALGGEFIRYGLCSALALACDMALLLFLHHVLGMHYLLAAAIGFAAGLFIAYATSVRYAFRERRLTDSRSEFAAFALVGILGLGLTQILLHLFVTYALLPVATAKIMTAGFVFLFNFTLRKFMLFTQRGT